jgi:hypothetical protein
MSSLSGTMKTSDQPTWRVLVGIFLVLIFGRSAWYTGQVWPSFAGLTLALSSIVCLIILVCKWKSPTQVGPLSTILLAAFVVIGMWAKNSDVSGLLGLADEYQIASNRERWEVVALASTAFMAALYFDEVKSIMKCFDDRGVGGAEIVNLLLFVSIVVIYVAIIFLKITKFHYLFVLGVALIFTFIDGFIWYRLRGATAEQINALRKSHESWRYFILLDVPVLLGLAAIGAFFWTLGCDQRYLTTMVPSGFTYETALANPCVEVFPFVGGAIAFQMIAYNVIYVIFALELHTER